MMCIFLTGICRDTVILKGYTHPKLNMYKHHERQHKGVYRDLEG